MNDVVETVEEQVVEQHREFKVWEENLPVARGIVEKVNRKAAKYGLPGYELSVGELRQEPVLKADSLFSHIDGSGYKVVAYRGFYMVELVGEMPKFEGWSFVASLDYSEEGGVITRPVPGVEVDLSAHRARAAECDYCNTKRDRNATYVLLHEDGRMMQVGSSCVQPFMGIKVSGLAWLASSDSLSDLSELGDEDGGGGGGYGAPGKLSVDALMVATMAVEQVRGWKSRGVAQQFGGLATIDVVLAVLEPRSKKDQELVAEILGEADMEAAAEKAEKVLDWARTQDGRSEWAENLRVLAHGSTVGWRNAALLASAVAGYNRHLGEVREREQRVPSTWFGEAKKRQAFEGEVVYKTTMDGDYGLRSLILLRNAEGQVATWWTGWSELETGDQVTGKVTVKGHETYKEEKRTVVTRCALEVVPAAK